MMKFQTIYNIATSCGWKLISRNANGMISFYNETKTIRLNIYSTTGTVTFQNMLKKYDKGEIYKNVTEEKLWELLKEIL